MSQISSVKTDDLLFFSSYVNNPTSPSLPPLFKSGATRPIRRLLRFLHFIRHETNETIRTKCIKRNHALIDQLVYEIDCQKQHVESNVDTGLVAEHVPVVNPTISACMARAIWYGYKPEDSYQSTDKVNPVVQFNKDLEAMKFDFERMSSNYRTLGYNTLVARTETGVELPFQTWEEYKEMCTVRNYVLQLRYSKNGPIVGGYRGKKPMKKKKKLRGRRPAKKIQTMDCSPGNVYESSALMVTDATGALNIVIALNNPQQIFSGVTATGAQDLANNWDAYSVERVSMSTQIRAPITARQGEWNLICDHDSSPPSTAITQNLLLTYTDKRSYSSQASPRWSVTPRKLSQCEYISAPAADPEPAVIVSKGKYDWNTPPANGFMYVKLIGGPASTNIGTIYVRVHVTAWYKRRLAIAVPSPSFVCPMLKEEDSSEESDEKVKKPVKKKKDC